MTHEQKPIGVQQTLSDAGAYTMEDIRMAAKMGTIEAMKRHGKTIPLRELEDMCDNIAKIILNKKR